MGVADRDFPKQVDKSGADLGDHFVPGLGAFLCTKCDFDNESGCFILLFLFCSVRCGAGAAQCDAVQGSFQSQK
jgi:hypothetical protein